MEGAFTMVQEDLTGKRFGHLTVLSADKGKSRSYWVCRCDCGKICSIQSGHLKDGHTKSCGCLRKNNGKNRWIDLTGHQYGRLTVLRHALPEDEKLYSEGENGKIGTEGEKNQEKDLWLCRCSCGTLCICDKELLRVGKTQSCGCLREAQRKENMKKAIHFVDGTCIERIASRKTFANNTSGHRGVYLRSNGRWRACIGFQGKVYNLGNFEKYENAVEARLDAERRFYDAYLESYREKESLGEESDGNKGTEGAGKNVSVS